RAQHRPHPPAAQPARLRVDGQLARPPPAPTPTRAPRRLTSPLTKAPGTSARPEGDQHAAPPCGTAREHRPDPVSSNDAPNLIFGTGFSTAKSPGPAPVGPVELLWRNRREVGPERETRNRERGAPSAP